MIKRIFAFLLFSVFVSHIGFTQNDSTRRTSWLSLGIGVGALSYFGDLKNSQEINPLSHTSQGFDLYAEYRCFSNFGISGGIMKGKLEYNQRTISENLNFQSEILQYNLTVKYYFNSNGISSNSVLVSPYIGLGFSHLKFDPKGDLKDNENRNYFYWTDGTIRDLPETIENELYAIELKKDFSYETTLTDSIHNYKRTTFCIPLIAGLKFKLSPSVNANLGLSYYLSQSDFIDNNNSIKKNDNFLYTNFSVNYNFGFRKAGKETEFSTVDFSLIEKNDEDNDGVADTWDACPHTPLELKIDARGCPIDSDNDGIPDYKDKEIKSKKGNIVSHEGISLTDELIQEKFTKDSIIEYKVTVEQIIVKDSLSLQQNILEKTIMIEKNGIKLTESNTINTLPTDLIVADFNKDGQIKANEIMMAIDAFFDDNKDISVDVINKLIDYFFNQ